MRIIIRGSTAPRRERDHQVQTLMPASIRPASASASASSSRRSSVTWRTQAQLRGRRGSTYSSACVPPVEVPMATMRSVVRNIVRPLGAERDTHGLVRVIGEPHQMRVERRNHPSRLDRGRDPIE